MLKKSFEEKPATRLYQFNPNCLHNEAKIYSMSHKSEINEPYSTKKNWEQIIKKLSDKDTDIFASEILHLPNRNWYKELIDVR